MKQSTEIGNNTLNHTLTRFKENDSGVFFDWQKKIDQVKEFSQRTNQAITLGKRMREPCDLSLD
jgi:hypothetical protein